MSERSGRLDAIDWLRGFVMVLMAIDHASGTFNGGRVAIDSMYPVVAFFVPAWEPGTALPPLQFATRWITHLCAPTFLFLSGTSLALSAAGRQARGQTRSAIDRHLCVRGLLLIAFDLTWLSMLPSAIAERYYPVLQVLYAIGASLCAMALLRHLPTRVLVGSALALLVLGEWLSASFAPIGEVGPLAALLLAPGTVGPVAVAYPALPWLAMMMLGWAFGAQLLALRARGRPASDAAGSCVVAGLAAIALFVALRAMQGYGNLGLLRDDGGWLQWLHVSKYPPSLSFAALELGCMAVLLGALLAYEARRDRPRDPRHPLLVLGRTALFFYLLHFPLLGIAAVSLGLVGNGGLLHTYVAAAAVTAVLYPVCRVYASYKAAHPRGWAQYI